MKKKRGDAKNESVEEEKTLEKKFKFKRVAQWETPETFY